MIPKYPYFCHLFVLRTLSTSDDVEDRETEKGRLEEAYEKCDRDLDELIVQHYTELTTAIRTYQSITERITNSRNKIKQVKSGCEISLVENASNEKVKREVDVKHRALGCPQFVYCLGMLLLGV